MKKRCVILSVLTIVILAIIGFGNEVSAAETEIEIKIGEEKSFTFSDLTVGGVVPTKIKNADSNNTCISVEEIETKLGFIKAISEIKVKGISEGTSILTITYEYPITTIDAYGNPQNMTSVGSKQYDIKIIDKEKQIQEEVDELEFREDIENNKIEKWEEDYKKDINVVDGEGPTYKRDYLQSILYQDKKNGNKDLWNKFVKETTPEQRYNWYRAIIPLRDETNGIQEAKKALKAQIDLDKGNITQEEADKTLNDAR